MVMTVVALGLLGLCFGSFIHAVVWRIHKKRNFVTERSECDYCHHRLSALDLIPVFSWVMLGGKCRYCHASIAWQHPVIELTVGLLFVVSYIFWPQQLTTWPAQFAFAAWLLYVVGLTGLFIYDLRWMILPNEIVYTLLTIGVVDVAVYFASQGNALGVVGHSVLGAASIGGVYALLYFVSKGKWVGFGDVKLGIFMGLVLGWQRGVLALVLANVIGLAVVLPGLLTKRLNRHSHIPFGPFLIIAFFVAGLFGTAIINWYLTEAILR